MSVYEGVTHLTHPPQVADPTWNYVVLGFAFAFESGSSFFAYRAFQKERGAIQRRKRRELNASGNRCVSVLQR